MSRAAKLRIFTFLFATGTFLLVLVPGTANAQTCCGSGCNPPPPPPSVCVLSDDSVFGLPSETGCPSTVHATVVWGMVKNSTYDPKNPDTAASCSFACLMNTGNDHTNSFEPPGECVTSTIGSPQPSSENSTLTVTFQATDKIVHNMNIITTVIDSRGGYRLLTAQPSVRNARLDYSCARNNKTGRRAWLDRPKCGYVQR